MLITREELVRAGFSIDAWDFWKKQTDTRIWKFSYLDHKLRSSKTAMLHTGWRYTFDLTMEFNVTSIKQVKKIVALYD